MNIYNVFWETELPPQIFKQICFTVQQYTLKCKLNVIVKVDVCSDWRNERRKLFLILSLHWTPSLRLLIFWYPLTHEVYLYLVTHQLLTDCATLYYQDTAPAATAAQQLQLRSESWHLFTCSPPPPPPLFTDPHTGAPLKTTFYRFGSNVVIVLYSNCHAKLRNTGVQFLH